MLPSTGTNRYGDLIKELYQGIKDGSLSDPRLDEITRLFNELSDRESIYSLWLGEGQNPYFKGIIRAREGYFEFTPLELMSAMRSSSDQSVSNNTETVVSLNTAKIGLSSSGLFYRDGTKIRFSPLAKSRVIGIIGKIQWETNGTGRRGVHVNYYNEAGSLLYGETMHSMPPTGVDSDTLPFAKIFPLGQDGETEYFQFTVIQTSGGALNLEHFDAGIFLLK